MKNFGQSFSVSSFSAISAISVALAIVCTLHVNAEGESGSSPRDTGWSREVVSRMEPGVPFMVVGTSSIDGHLSASCGYQYLANRGAVLLHGAEAPRADLSPFVTYEVATEDKTKWKTIRTFNDSINSKKTEVNPTNSRVLLQVNMDPFRSEIGTARWGRLVLENGDAAIFAISDLLPTGNSPDAQGGSFKQHIEDLNPNRLGSSFELVTVTSFSRRVVGDFIFAGHVNQSSTLVRGTKTSDGDFWPSVTLEASDSGNNWKKVGRSSEQGMPISLDVIDNHTLRPLRVVLDAYRTPFQGYKYGKVIFSDGKFAVFETAELKPH
jgi:hypothetical protein